MEIKTVEPSDKTVILEMTGRLNIEEVNFFESEYDKFITWKRYIALDMGGINYIDSSGIGALIKAMNMAKNINAELLLLELKPTVMNVFKLAYLDKFFTIIDRKELLERYPDFNAHAV